jgi:hypothetical protein
MFARNSSTPSYLRSLLCIATVVALGSFGTGCASTTPEPQVISTAHTAPHADSRTAHFDREFSEYRYF